MAIIGYSPWADAANVGQGIGQSIAQVLVQVPLIKRQIANEERRMAIEEERLGQQALYQNEKLRMQGEKDKAQVDKWAEDSKLDRDKFGQQQARDTAKTISEAFGMVMEHKKLKLDQEQAQSLDRYRQGTLGVAKENAAANTRRTDTYVKEYPIQNMVARDALRTKRAELEQLALLNNLPEDKRVRLPELEIDRQPTPAPQTPPQSSARPIDTKLQATAAVVSSLAQSLANGYKGVPQSAEVPSRKTLFNRAAAMANTVQQIGTVQQEPAVPIPSAPQPETAAPVEPEIVERPANGAIPPTHKWKVRHVESGKVFYSDVHPEMLSAEYELVD